ncbi:hypothetical protein LEMLEM_LOCUS9258 [Lemmus lemmus]
MPPGVEDSQTRPLSESRPCLTVNFEVLNRIMGPYNDDSTRTMIILLSWKTPPKGWLWTTNCSRQFRGG